ncbi:hypothetical protein NBRC116188_15550 [Oceaniserpentilla sp. 4NH20-0058]|uniref:TonB-dependent receptor plug domain-containing protein n=1 Tax=Oceaniserpentilla sp. 4NH20-0058 TaxID=3127660 RepID=UPI003101E490
MKVLLIVVAVITWTPHLVLAEPSDDEVDLFELPLESLMNIAVKGVASLTNTQRRHIPASITYISHKDIRRSGARSLDDLLSIYVPGFQVWLKTNGNPMGMRGIISDRNTKMLLLVNGRLMNEHTALGIVSERYLSMLGDIKSIEVIRGPGSQVYGPGAIAGVINITTFNGENILGQKVSVKAGALEEFYSFEFQTGNQLDSGANLYFYYGVDKYLGADNDKAPMTFSSDFTNAVTNDSAIAYEPVPFSVPSYKAAYPDSLRQKLHIDYRYEDLSTWLRYTQGGQTRDLSLNTYSNKDPASAIDEGIGYQQITFTSQYQPTINDSLRLDARISYDIFDVEFGSRHYREDEINMRLLAHWQIQDEHKLSAGIEYSNEYFGKKSLSYPNEPVSISSSLTNLDSGQWQTHMTSVLSDYQWNVNSQWTLFAGLRSDKHSYTQWMHSPRLAAVLTTNKHNQIKVLLNRSVRRADDDNLREYYLLSGSASGQTETLNAIELSWEHQWMQNNRNLISIFYNDYDLIGWDSSAQEINPLGNLKTIGVEAESHIQWQKNRLSVLYSYADEQAFTLDQAGTNQFISASVYGYGSDLANYAKHTMKLIYQHSFNSQWDGFTSLRALMALDGSEAMADYNLYENNNSLTSLPRTDGSGRAFESRYYWDLSVQYHVKNMQIGIFAYNVLGWLDQDLNRRNVFGRSGQYRLEAPSISTSLQYQF